MVRKAILAVVLAMASVCPAWAQDEKEAVVLHVTSKLGVKTKVKVKTVHNPGVFAGFFFEPKAGEQAPDLLAVDRGHGLYITVPLRQLKHIVNGEKESVVTLADGTVHNGQVRTRIIPDPALDDSEPDGFYLLSKAAEATNLGPSKPKAPNPERKRFVLKVAERVPGKGLVYPPARTFHVYHPGRHDEKFRFPMIVNGEKFEVNPADFERIAVFKKDKEWHITVKAPEAQERTGKLNADNLRIVEAETITGARIAMPLTPFDTGAIEFVESHGFILERHVVTGK